MAFEHEPLSDAQQQLEQKLTDMQKGHLKRIMVNHLLLCGASSSIEQIKEAIDKVYSNSDHFMPTLIEISDKSTDQDGKIRFRLKDDPQLLALSDPYLFV